MISTVFIGVNALDTSRNDICLDLPAHSPVTHGMLRIQAEVDGDIIRRARPILGSMHRGAEKLFESRDYRQILMLANRHEWLSPFSGEVGVAQLLESALGIEVPNDAQQLRKLLLSYSTVTSHLAFLAGFPWSNGEIGQALRVERERWVEHFHTYVGTRMHPMITRIGGLTHAPTGTWLAHIPELVSHCTEVLSTTSQQLAGEGQLNEIGIITDIDVVDFALSGPSSHPGDVYSRLELLVKQTFEASAEANALATSLATHTFGDVNVLLPKVLRVPEGSYEHSIDTPLGTASWFLVSRGDKMPYRLKLRPSSLHTVLALSAALRDAHISDAAKIIASMPFLTGDAER